MKRRAGSSGVAVIVGGLAIIAGALFCGFGWFTYHTTLAFAEGAREPSAFQVSQVANQATVSLLAGIGLMVFGLVLIVNAQLSHCERLLENIRDERDLPLVSRP